MTTHAKLFYTPETPQLRYLPEGPRLLRNSSTPDRKLLGWVAIQYGEDIFRGSFNILDLEHRTNQTFDIPGRPGFFAETTKPGTVVLGVDRRLILLDTTTGAILETGLHLPNATDDVIINDGGSVPEGLIFGTKHLQFNQAIAKLYLFDAATREIRVLADGQTCSNGKFYQSDPATGDITLIDVDSSPKRITRYRFTKGFDKLISSELVVDPASLPAFPDGIRPSGDGKSIVVALFNTATGAQGSAITIDLATGQTTSTWTIDESARVTCPEIFEWEGKPVAIFTTATEGMQPDDFVHSPQAGSFYIGDVPFEAAPPAPPLVDINSLLPPTA
ncbi:gluconolactonase [Bryobacterales bacterium F-183]|nr:gluconolactonase [Bryobacterales bacterium F-183]